jgi:hypothetical protein
VGDLDSKVGQLHVAAISFYQGGFPILARAVALTTCKPHYITRVA